MRKREDDLVALMREQLASFERVINTQQETIRELTDKLMLANNRPLPSFYESSARTEKPEREHVSYDPGPELFIG